MRFIPVRFRQRILLGLGVLVLGFLGATASVDMLGIPGTAIQGRFGETRAAAIGDMELMSALVAERIALWFKERRSDLLPELVREGDRWRIHQFDHAQDHLYRGAGRSP
ncbi:MAG: hypothetical protein WAW42_00935 [Candidatus Competibacteraceae bacterium]